MRKWESYYKVTGVAPESAVELKRSYKVLYFEKK